MDDLYAILRISPSASASEIESRLSSVSTYEAARIRAILLVEARRKAYDKAHLAMRRTSILRSTLGVTNSAYWPRSLHQHWLGDPISKKAHSSTTAGSQTEEDSSLFANWLDNPLPLIVLAVLAVVLFFAIVGSCTERMTDDQSSTQATDQASTRSHPSASETTPNTAVPGEDLSDTLPRPRSGTVFKKRGSGVAGLKVTATSGRDVFIKVVDPSSRIVVRSFYLRAAKTEMIKVPIGTYHVYVNSGKYWYGSKLGFGPGSAFTRLEHDFKFYQTEDGVMGNEITLGAFEGGNLPSEGVDRSEFEGLE